MTGHWAFCPAFTAPAVGAFPAVAASGDCTCRPPEVPDSPPLHEPTDRDADNVPSDEDRVRHNHMTRDIKPFGQCPACNRHHQMFAAAEEETHRRPEWYQRALDNVPSDREDRAENAEAKVARVEARCQREARTSAQLVPLATFAADLLEILRGPEPTEEA